MLYREIFVFFPQIHTKHVNTLCGQNVEFVNIKPGGTYSNHWALKGLIPYAGWLMIGHRVEQAFFFRSGRILGGPTQIDTQRTGVISVCKQMKVPGCRVARQTCVPEKLPHTRR
jgi:hypothetical protein